MTETNPIPPAQNDTSALWAQTVASLGALAAVALPGSREVVAGIQLLGIVSKLFAASGGVSPEVHAEAVQQTKDVLAQLNSLRSV